MRHVNVAELPIDATRQPLLSLSSTVKLLPPLQLREPLGASTLCGSYWMGPQSATLTLDIEGKHHTVQATGNGPVDATFNAIKALVPNETTLELYQVHAVTEGTDAQAEVSVRLAENGKSVTAKGADPDTLVASAKAYLGALNKLLVKRQKGKPEAMVPPEKPALRGI